MRLLLLSLCLLGFFSFSSQQDCVHDECECVADSNACLNLRCCDLASAFIDARTEKFGAHSLLSRCMCCSCANVNCTNKVNYNVDYTSHNTNEGEKKSIKPVVAVVGREMKKDQRTIADLHRELYATAEEVEIRGEEEQCLEYNQVCNCALDSDSCSSSLCCGIDASFDSSVLNKRKLIRGDGVTRGDIHFECDCCSCSQVDCTDSESYSEIADIDTEFIGE